MNQSNINEFFVCLSRLTMADQEHHDNHSHSHSHIHAREEHSHDHHDPYHSHDHDDYEEDSHGVVTAKATAMLLFCATTICGATPFLINRYFKGNDKNASSDNTRSAVIVKCLLYFGGGVLLCTTFLHLLPEVREAVEGLQECGTFPELSFPLVELLMCAGFFLMFLIEELIHTYIHRNRNILDEDTVAFERAHSIRHSYVLRNKGGSGDNTSSVVDDQSKKSFSPPQFYSNEINENEHQHNNHQRAPHQPQAVCPTAPAIEADRCSVVSHHSHTHNHHSHNHHHNHFHLSPKNGTDDDNIIASSLRGLLIVLALSVHELFEGLAIGLEGSASNVWFMFAAVSAHKLVLAFCVGVELIVARTKIYLSVIFVFTFAVVSPIGIGVGMLVSNHNSTAASSIPSAVLQGLACGTLLYVVFFEILSKDRSGLLGYLAIIVGFGVMFGLQQLVSGHHSHSHGCPSHTDEQHSNHKHSKSEESIEKQLEILREVSSNLKQILNKN